MRVISRILIVLLVVVLISEFSFSQIIVSSGSKDSHNSAVAVNQDGVVLVVWCSEGGPEAGTLWYNVNKEGVWQGAKNTHRTYLIAWSPQLDVDSNGLFHLAWADGHSSNDREIYYCIFDPDNGWSEREMVHNSPYNSAWERIVVVDDIVYVIWYHAHQDIYGWISDIVMKSKPVGGYWPGKWERLSWHVFDESTHPAFDVRNGIVRTAYMESDGSENGTWRLCYKEGDYVPGFDYWRFNTPLTLSEPAWYPDMEVDNNSDSHIIWATKSGRLLYRQQKNDVWAGVQDISNMYCPPQHPDLHYNANNVLCAAWRQQDAEGSHIYYSIKSPPGKFSTPEKVAPAIEGEYPQVWIDDFGYAHFVYDERNGSRRVMYEKIKVYDPPARLEVSKKKLDFTIEGDIPPNQSFVIKNDGVNNKNLKYSITKTKDWLSLSRIQGILSANKEHKIDVSINAEDKDIGVYTDTITITAPEAINGLIQIDVELTVLVPPIYEPLNFSKLILLNRALLYKEYVHQLTWQANPKNRDIVSYRLYKREGNERNLIASVSATTFEYVIRWIKDASEIHDYELVAVDKRGHEGPPAKLSVSGGPDQANRLVMRK